MGLYSHSRRAVYETCPREDKFQYVYRLEVPDEAGAILLFLGSRVQKGWGDPNEAIEAGREGQ